MCGAPTIVPRVVYELCLPRFHPCISRRGLSIAEAPCGVKTLRQAAPWLSQAGLHPCEDYNYKSLPKVTGCNLPGGNDPFLESRRGAASHHCSYENNAD